MATATAKRRTLQTATGDPSPPEMGEDGYPQRIWIVDGQEVTFSLKPFADAEKPLYYNPIYPGQQMWWRSQDRNEYGFQPVIQKETWWDGKFFPRNAWEEYMTVEYLKTLTGGNVPMDAKDKNGRLMWRPDANGVLKHPWCGDNHPDGPGHVWRCECSWPCGNWAAFKQHRLFLRHRESVSE